MTLPLRVYLAIITGILRFLLIIIRLAMLKLQYIRNNFSPVQRLNLDHLGGLTCVVKLLVQVVSILSQFVDPVGLTSFDVLWVVAVAGPVVEHLQPTAGGKTGTTELETGKVEPTVLGVGQALVVTEPEHAEIVVLWTVIVEESVGSVSTLGS